MPTKGLDDHTAKFVINGIINDIDLEVLKQIFRLSDKEKLNPYNIEKVIFNPPATVIIFKDGTKEVVKCSKDDEFDAENGFAQAMMNIMFGSRSNFKRFIEKYEEI